MHSLMNIHESQLDEFSDEQKFKQLNLSPEQQEAWIQVHLDEYTNNIKFEQIFPAAGHIFICLGLVYWSQYRQ